MIRRWFTIHRSTVERTVAWAAGRSRSAETTSSTALAEIVDHHGYAVRACGPTPATALEIARTLPAFARPSIDDLADGDPPQPWPAGESEDPDSLRAVLREWEPWAGTVSTCDETVAYADSAGGERAYRRRTYRLEVRPLDPTDPRVPVCVEAATWSGLLDAARDEIAWRGKSAGEAAHCDGSPDGIVLRSEAARLLLHLVATDLIGGRTKGIEWLIDDPDGRTFDDTGWPTAPARCDRTWLTADGRIRPGHIAFTDGGAEIAFTKLRAAPDAPLAAWPAGLVVDDLRLVNDTAGDGLLLVRPRRSWWFDASGARATPVTVAGTWTAYHQELELEPIGPQAVRVSGLRAAGRDHETGCHRL